MQHVYWMDFVYRHFSFCYSRQKLELWVDLECNSGDRGSYIYSIYMEYIYIHMGIMYILQNVLYSPIKWLGFLWKQDCSVYSWLLASTCQWSSFLHLPSPGLQTNSCQYTWLHTLLFQSYPFYLLKSEQTFLNIRNLIVSLFTLMFSLSLI